MTTNGTEERPLPNGWIWTTLESVIENHDSNRVPVRKSDRAEMQGQYPYYGASGIIDYVDDFLFEGDYLLLAEDGANLLSRSTPISFQARGKFWVNNHAHVMKTKNGIPLSYLEHYLNSIDLANFITGTAQPKLTQRNMNKIPVPVAPALEQERIVGEIEKQFTRLDQAAASLRRLNSNLARYKASVLKAACEGRLVPQDPADEPADQLLARILAERRAQWQKANPGKKYKEPVGVEETAVLPELPHGWVWATWEQLSPRVTVGHVGSMKDEYVDEGIPFLRSQNVRENRYDPEGLKFISPAFDEQLSKSQLKPGDIVVVRSGSVGVTCVIPETLEHANCSDLVIIQKPPYFVSEYGAYYMNSLAKRFIRAGQVGVALVHFNTKSVAALPLPLPPLAEQERIVAEVERRLSVVSAVEQTITANLSRAERLRQSILHRAFTGQLVPQEVHHES